MRAIFGSCAARVWRMARHCVSARSATMAVRCKPCRFATCTPTTFPCCATASMAFRAHWNYRFSSAARILPAMCSPRSPCRGPPTVGKHSICAKFPAGAATSSSSVSPNMRRRKSRRRTSHSNRFASTAQNCCRRRGAEVLPHCIHRGSATRRGRCSRSAHSDRNAKYRRRRRCCRSQCLASY